MRASLTDPTVRFLIVLAIGIVAGVIMDRLVAPSWLTRQFARSHRGLVTNVLVGVAGSFIGYHLALLAAGRTRVVIAYVMAAVASVLVLWGWRMLR